MWLPLFGVLAGVGVSLARGGRFNDEADVDLRAISLLLIAVALQTLLDGLAVRGPVQPATVASLLLMSESAVLGFVVLNWFRPGMGLIALGFTLNAVTILANTGMPVAPSAVEWLGADPYAVGATGKHLLMTEGTRLKALGDILPIPVIKMVVSIGDVVLVAGMIPLAHDLLTPRSLDARRQRRAVRPRGRAGGSVQPG